MTSKLLPASDAEALILARSIGSARFLLSPEWASCVEALVQW